MCPPLPGHRTCGGGNVQSNIGTEGEASINVAYTYTPSSVPCPNPLAWP